MNPFLLDCAYTGLSDVSSIAQGDTITEAGDAAGSSSTAAMFGVGDFFTGELAFNSDRDWIEVTLDAGTYTIAGVGLGPLDTALNDIAIYLRDTGGNEIEYDDLDGPGLNAQITFTVSATSTYYIDVQSFNGSDSGSYGISIAEGNRATFSAEMAAGNLLRPNQAWTTTPGVGTTEVTWAFRDTGTPYGSGTFAGTQGEDLNAPQQQLAASALAYLDAISGLEFVQVNPGGTSDNATILFGTYSANDGASAFAYYPGSSPGGQTAASSRAGDVWLNKSGGFGSGANYDFGSFANFAMLHELGHAIGLAHPGDYNAGSGISITYSNSAQYLQDSQQYTIMSYFDETLTGASSGLRYPDTFLLHDYLALHQLYGADSSYHAGNSTYGFNISGLGPDGAVYDFTSNSTPFLSIYDGAGTDTIDLSGYGMANFLSLEQGVLSDVGGYRGNLSIAFDTEIEHAKGGTGDDTIMGNDLANDISGGDGLDEIYGESGDDTLDGGDQDDIIDGGEGFDRVFGGMGNDTLTGGAQKDLLSGGNGDDSLDGGFGNDKLIGGRGDDHLTGGNRHDRLVGGDGEDTLFGGDGDDRMRGNAQSDLMFGESGDDSMNGGGGFDTIDGGDGDDYLTGGFNADQFIFVDGHGVDTITDFAATNDLEKIDFSGHSTLKTLADILGTGDGTAATTQVGLDLVVETGGGNRIILQNVSYDDLDAFDFTF